MTKSYSDTVSTSDTNEGNQQMTSTTIHSTLVIFFTPLLPR